MFDEITCFLLLCCCFSLVLVLLVFLAFPRCPSVIINDFAIITTDVAGCRQTVIGGENGLLVPAKSVDKLVEAMSFFITKRCHRLLEGAEASDVGFGYFHPKIRRVKKSQQDGG